MTEIGWFFIFLLFIALIAIILWASGVFGTGNGVVNNGVAVGAVNNNGAVVFQPGVGFVAGTTTGGTGWSSWTIIGVVFVVFIIIALIIWAVYPRRPVVVAPPPPPMPMPMPMQMPPPPPPQVTEYHHYIEPVHQTVAALPPVVAPVHQVVAAPVHQVVAAPIRSVAAVAPANGYDYPTTHTRHTVSQEPSSFDPDPVATHTYVQGRDSRGVYHHSDLGPVSGHLHQGGRVVQDTVDVGRHQVVTNGRTAPSSYIGAGIPSGYRTVASSVYRDGVRYR